MSAVDYDASDPTFVDDLMKSKGAVERAARWLSDQGIPVVIRPTFIRPDASRMGEFSDDGDLEIIQRVEVKRRVTTHFTGRRDFPYASVIVDVCHAYDNARQKPYAYLIFNADMTCLIVIDCKATRDKWFKVSKADRLKGRERSFYECPVDCVKFVAIPEEGG